MKRLIQSLMIAALLSFKLAAASLTLTLGATSVTNVLTQGVVIYKITLANASGSNANVKLFDTATAITNVVGPYTNFTLTSGYVTNIFSNILGISTTNIYTNVLIQAAQNVAQTTNSMPVLIALTVPTATTGVSSPVNPYFAFSGVTVTNDAVSTITIEYAPFK